MLQNLPTKYKDNTGKVHNLQNDTLKCSAWFRSNDRGLKILLIPREELMNEGTKLYEPVRGTGASLKFSDGRLEITNKKVLQLLMASPAYLSGKIHIDPDDPSGFWRQAGMVKVKQVEVAVFDGATHPTFDNINIGDITKPEDPVIPLSRVM